MRKLLNEWDREADGNTLYSIVRDLFPLCRSITGDGLRESFSYLGKYVDITLHEVPSGTRVFDWTVPREWNIRDAYIKNQRGERVVDFRSCNLHVLNYSVPVYAKMPLAELKQHIHTLPESPDWVPYRTSYYRDDWGFCMSHRQLSRLPDEEYEVCIDATLAAGHMTIGELRIQGRTNSEVIISAHSCHPSLCNDNLSGMAVATLLAQRLARLPLRYSYRFLWMPGTIGAIAWLALNESVVPRIKHGLVLSCLGDPGKFSYKRSRRGDSEIDQAVENLLFHSGREYQIFDFSPYGYDERQFCSPGFNLPVGCFMRTPNGRYPEYHTSADNLDFVTRDSLSESLRHLLEVVFILENNSRYLNLNPKCEPQLGRRGLYEQVGGKTQPRREEAMLWILNLSDGEHSLLDIAQRSGMPFPDLFSAAELLEEHRLLKKLEQ
ncbi:MAG: DUF4910 domain-containing protein [Acidobacteria bacterium]|nr:DUF4910 domain-containing protein [Acidobacteriota bacterium]